MNTKKAISIIVGLEETNNFKTIIQHLKSLNSAVANPLKMKELRRLVRKEISERKRLSKLNTKNNPLKIQSGKELLKSNLHQEWIIQDILPEGSISIISAKPGSFKTWLTLYFAICIAKGESVFGVFKVKQSRVLIIDEEDSRALIKNRLIKLGDNGNTDINFSIMNGFMADNEEKMQILMDELKRRKIKVLIMDSLVRIHSGDENSARDMSSLFRKISILKENGITVLITHHHRKGQNNQNYDNQEMRGSVDILAALDCHMMVKKDGEDLKIKQTKNRYMPEISPFKISFVEEDKRMVFAFKEYSNGLNTPTDKQDKNREAVLSFINKRDGAITQDEIYREFQGSIGKNNILTILKNLEQEQKIKIITGNKNRKLYIKGSVF
ncbi:MAG: AAA family ATPase [Patescibacteria group bacterium]|nr:AAA family ATPase [Patescibacteria group bacterium]